MTWSMVSRSDRAFSETKTEPVLVWEPPVNPTTASTAGSARTMSMNWVSLPRMSWKDVLWSAWMRPVRRPVSCWGKKPLGITT